MLPAEKPLSSPPSFSVMLVTRQVKKAGVSLESYLLQTMRDCLDAPEESEDALTLENPYEHYQGDPVGFCQNVLGEVFTPEVENMLREADLNSVVLARSANGTGKTKAAASFIVYWYKVYPGSQVWTAAAPPESNLRTLLWGEIGAIVEKVPHVFNDSKISLDSMKITRIGDSRSGIRGVTIPAQGTEKQREARFSGKHCPYLLFVVDEGDAVPPEVYRGIEACASGGVTRLLVLYNPRHEAGPVYQMERARAGRVVRLHAFEHPNVKTGLDVVPGAVSREVTVRRINAWTVSLPENERPDQNCFEVPDFLVGTQAKSLGDELYPPLPAGWRRVVEQSFHYMVLADYPTLAEDQLISTLWIEAAVSRWQANGGKPPVGVRPVIGLDVADIQGQDLSSLCLRYGGWVAPLLTWKGLDPVQTGRKGAEVYLSNVAHWANVDATGVGAGAVRPFLDKGLAAYRIMVQSTPTEDAEDIGQFDSIRTQMLWAVREWLRTDVGAMLPPDADLQEELGVLMYCKSPRTGKLSITDTDTIKEKILRSPDKLMSLALTFAPQPDDAPAKVEVINYAYGRPKNGRVGLGM